MADEQQRTLLSRRRVTLLAALGRAEAFASNFDVERDQGQVSIRLGYLDSTWVDWKQLRLNWKTAKLPMKVLSNML